jgi:fumarate reductase flavoprotein subunit
MPDANEALDHGYDLIAVGRATIAYPDWTDRIAAGKTWSCLWTAPSAKR